MSRKTARFGLLVLGLGMGACKAKPKQKAEDTKGATANEAEPTEKRAFDAGPAKELAPERFTLSEINQVLLKLQACVEKDSSLAHMSECGCLSDLALSNEEPPEDAEAYCRDFAAKIVAISEQSEEEQMKQEYLLAAKDIPPPGSAALFSFAAPCMMNALKKKSKNHHNLCVCATHALANGMQDYPATTAEEVMKAMDSVGKDMAESKVCQP